MLIRCPVHEVWEYCIDPNNVVVWLPGIEACEPATPGPCGVGTVWRGRYRFLGVARNWHGEFTRFDPEKGTEFRSDRGGYTGVARTSFESTDEGVRLTYHDEAESGLGGVFGKFADPVVSKAYTRALRASLQILADVLDRD